MAYAAVEAQALSASGGTTHTYNLPSGITSGELLVAVVFIDGNPTLTPPSGWTIQQTQPGTSGQATVMRVVVMTRTADGTEGSTISVGSSANESASSVVLRISGWQDFQVDAGSTTGANSLTIDPPSSTASWGSADNLWIAIAGHDQGQGVCTAFPSGWTPGPDTADGRTGSAAGALAYLFSTNATEDPGSFTFDDLEENRGLVMVVRGTSAESIRVGDSTPTAAYIGDTTVSAIYLGDVRLF